MSNQFTQSLAVLALDRTGELPDSAVDFLASTRCADGGFPLSPRRDPSRCTSDTDTTGMAVQALLAADRAADAEPGLDWLEGQQRENGGGFGYNAASAPNSNSTALAVQALRAGGRDEAADKGWLWLYSVQVGCGRAAVDRGAVGYLEPVANGMALRSTAQAMPALAGVALGDIDGAEATPDVEPIDCSTDPPPGATTGDTTEGGVEGGGVVGGGGEGQVVQGGTTTTGGGGGDATTTGGEASGSPASSTSSTSSPSTGGLGPEGHLASTGSSATEPLAWAAIGLLFTGAATYLLARHRGNRHPVS
ncbi:hypothetical protein [Streptomyces radicis]|uniref:LPXTG cell wall anchor domain-containing protein n=1 Tax=Streptomyces radicis TaxID=1750517 RepID=A0A3A9WCM1_9ACTN|nr:hypothetical protein [Streptomyces radicis]RKN05386.1 hypothetical protein D7319_25580 [Streptomyces radicis]RKN16894.1 hypothetical protein D7318_24945 [Streptomyces radicis]